MALTWTQRMGFRYFGRQVKKSKGIAKLDEQLQQAQMGVRGEAYLAGAYFVGALAAVAVLAVALLGFLVAVVLFDTPMVYGVFVLLTPGIGYYLGYAALATTPASNAKKRGKNINMKLPYAVNYITAMASAGVIPAEIFKSLARQEVYGEVAREAAWIYKDLEVHGMDVVTALHRAIERSPSIKFQDLLQGAITTITSGGDLTGYFRAKANRLQWENRQEQQQFIETMGLMAEAYVTAAVAGPLFLIVMVAIFVLIGSGDMIILQSIIYLLLPVASLGFMVGLKSMIPEV